MDSTRTEFSVEDYDFYGDENFQNFFHSKLPSEYIRRDRYIRILIACKKEWIRKLNAEIQKQAVMESRSKFVTLNILADDYEREE